jgi:hypothetical protein
VGDWVILNDKLIRMSVFVLGDLTPYGVTERYQCFGRTYCLSLHGCSEPGSSVSIVSGNWLGDLCVRGSTPAEAKGFFL